jgi:hypothetical protein
MSNSMPVARCLVRDDVPLAVVFTTALAPISAGVAPNDLIIERAAPPPLILVYCRLLI